MCAVELINDIWPQRKAKAWLLLAHGAGAPMTSPFMNEIACLVAERGFGVSRFEFAYMANRRTDGKLRPPPKAERLTSEFIAAITALAELPQAKGTPLVIGGKSMGGRVATLVADAMLDQAKIIGTVALGYPFHPPKKPTALRTDHLQVLRTPLLIVQGERDPFGSRSEVENYALSPCISVSWAKDGNHDLSPRVGQQTTHQANLVAAAEAIAAFVADLTASRMPPPQGV